jgi:hypothetical protein
MEQGRILVHDTTSGDSATERALRSRLAKLADQAPAAIQDLDRNLARRVTAVRRRRQVAFGAVAGVVLIGGVSAALTVPALRPGPPAERGRPAVLPANTLQCPQDLARFTLTTRRPGIARTLVPGTPSEMVICGYHSDNRRLGLGAVPARFQIPGLVAQLNGVSAGPAGWCAANNGSPMAQWASQQAVTQWLFRFRYPAGAEVDVRVTVGARCPQATNGVLRGALLVPVGVPGPGVFAPGGSPVPTTGNTTRPGAGGSSAPAPSPQAA